MARPQGDAGSGLPAAAQERDEGEERRGGQDDGSRPEPGTDTRHALYLRRPDRSTKHPCAGPIEACPTDWDTKYRDGLLAAAYPVLTHAV